MTKFSASVLTSQYVQTPVSHAKTTRSAAVLSTARAAPATTWIATCCATRASPWSGKRRASQTTIGVSAAHVHHSDSDRLIVSAQFAGRPVER